MNLNDISDIDQARDRLYSHDRTLEFDPDSTRQSLPTTDIIEELNSMIQQARSFRLSGERMRTRIEGQRIADAQRVEQSLENVVQEIEVRTGNRRRNAIVGGVSGLGLLGVGLIAGAVILFRK